MPLEIKEFTPAALVGFAEALSAELELSKKAVEDKFVEFRAGVAEKKSFDELQATVSTQFAELATKTQDLGLALNDVKKQLDNPLYGNKAEHDDSIRKSAVEHHRAIFNYHQKSKDPLAAFDEKEVDVKGYLALAGAQRKLFLVGERDEYARKFASLSPEEQKALSMSQIDSHYFYPEVLTAIRDCFLEPIGLFDLYDTFTISKMTFMYPFIKDHTLLGGYMCSDDCGTINAANLNLQFRHEQVYDWRGTLCITTRTLADANMDLLALVAREMALSKRMTSNKAWISGDGINQPKGWLTSNLFPTVKTGTPGVFNAADIRGFFYRVPPEYGNIQAVMHPNTLGNIMTMSNAFGEFLFDEGMLFVDNQSLTSKVRLSRYMPEIQWTVTPGTNTTPATITAPSGSLVAAAANWKKAYMVPTLLPMMMRQGYMIQGPWCAQYHFWAQDGGNGVCGEAGRVLVIQ
jgi:HK97 family phage major capsid protein